MTPELDSFWRHALNTRVIMDISLLIVIFAAFFLASILVYFFIKKQFHTRLSAVETQLASSEFVISELQSLNRQQQVAFQTHLNELNDWQLEHQQVSQQLEHRIKVLQEKLSSYQEQLTQIQQQQPQDRLYSRAQKMVALGADVDEIVRECELPVAEAEILISMHKKK